MLKELFTLTQLHEIHFGMIKRRKYFLFTALKLAYFLHNYYRSESDLVDILKGKLSSSCS